MELYKWMPLKKEKREERGGGGRRRRRRRRKQKEEEEELELEQEGALIGRQLKLDKANRHWLYMAAEYLELLWVIHTSN